MKDADNEYNTPADYLGLREQYCRAACCHQVLHKHPIASGLAPLKIRAPQRLTAAGPALLCKGITTLHMICRPVLHCFSKGDTAVVTALPDCDIPISEPHR